MHTFSYYMQPECLAMDKLKDMSGTLLILPIVVNCLVNHNIKI